MWCETKHITRQFEFIPQAPPAPSDPPKSGGPLNCVVIWLKIEHFRLYGASGLKYRIWQVVLSVWLCCEFIDPSFYIIL